MVLIYCASIAVAVKISFCGIVAQNIKKLFWILQLLCI